MNSLLKKIVILFTIIAVLVLLVFAVQLFVLNRDPGGESNTPEPSGGQSSETPDGGGTGDPAGADIDDGQNLPGDEEETPAAPTGTRYEMEMPGGAELVLLADEALFRKSSTEDSDIYTYLGGGTASLEIKFVVFLDDASGFAAGFLNEYIDYTGGEHSSDGMSLIGKSDITGRRVSAGKDGETYEAWIVEFDGEFAGMGFAVVVNYRDDEQKAALYRVLDTLELTGA